MEINRIRGHTFQTASLLPINIPNPPFNERMGEAQKNNNIQFHERDPCRMKRKK